MVTIAKALQQAQAFIPRLEARILLQTVMKVETSYLVAYDDQPLTTAQLEAYQRLVGRAGRGEPIPYLVGYAPFYGRRFKTTPAVLIPRPETEQIITEALRFWQNHQAQRIVDVGTGSGCIPITLAAEIANTTLNTSPRGLFVGCDIWGIDISVDALSIAHENAHTHFPADSSTPIKLNFHHGDLLSQLPIDAHSIDILIANLPYVSESEWEALDRPVRLYEPKLALVGGPDGLVLINQLLHQATDWLSSRSQILLEIGWRQGPAVKQMATAVFPQATIDILPDLAGRDRIVRIALQ